MGDSNENTIEAWRRVHLRLTLAIIQSRDNIAAQKTKKRCILEEMCSKLMTEQATAKKLKSAKRAAGQQQKVHAAASETARVAAPQGSSGNSAVATQEQIQLAFQMAQSLNNGAEKES
mmetsp:Transcript_37135/g.88875  ORF Transcript_37135/g.88875 Transcript_37135/m.88875 type:complete len:118 (+) Transcript_37135:318-671(+)